MIILGDQFTLGKMELNYFMVHQNFMKMEIIGFRYERFRKVSTVADTTLDTIKVVPNPYIVRSRFNETSISRKLRFTNLPQDVE